VCRWLACREALTGLPWWVPEDFLVLNAELDAEPGLCPGISTGLSCGRRGHPVLLRGLQEVIERDAVVGAWWGRYPLEEWEPDTVFASLGEEWTQRLTRPNLRYRFFRIRSPFSRHVTLATLEGEDREGFCFSIGSACREGRTESWRKAVLEAVQGRHYVRWLKALGPPAIGIPTDFSEHAVYYSWFPDRLANTVLAQPVAAKDDRAEAAEDLATLCTGLGSERPVLVRHFTPLALARERLDWHVVRVVVPGLQPLHGHHDFAHLGGPLWHPRGLAAWSALPPHPFP
jgi:ribosomal protein S12 methylthiotransferase accessory factor YcaO